MIDSVLIMSASRTVVLPVGLKPNGSFNFAGGIAGKMWSLTARRSNLLERIRVTKIGLRSLTPLIGEHLGTGVVIALHHTEIGLMSLTPLL